MRKLLLVLTILSIQQGVAQSQDAWVFFADKENVEVYLADPILIMTQEAIDRKALHGTAINERDVPVNENYITQIKNATPEEALEWSQTDYFMAMKFDPLVMFVVIPAAIQVVVLAFMLISMMLTGIVFD